MQQFVRKFGSTLLPLFLVQQYLILESRGLRFISDKLLYPMPRDLLELFRALELPRILNYLELHSGSQALRLLSYYFYERALCMLEMLQTACPIEMPASQLKLRLISQAR